MKSKSITLLIFSFLLIGTMAVMLNVFLVQAHDDFRKSVKVGDEGIAEETVTVRGLSLSPTQSQEYEISMSCAASGSYDIALDYEETQDGGLKHHVIVSVYTGGERIYNGLLLDLLDNDTVVEFVGYLDDEPLIIKVIYEMPYYIGNEAQGTFADFDVHINVKKS